MGFDSANPSSRWLRRNSSSAYPTTTTTATTGTSAAVTFSPQASSASPSPATLYTPSYNSFALAFPQQPSSPRGSLILPPQSFSLPDPPKPLPVPSPTPPAMAAAQQPSQALASHLVSQTLSSVALLEQLQLITPADATAIRTRLPNPYATFPQLATTTPAAPVAAAAPQYTPSLPACAPPPAAAAPAAPHAKALWDYNGAEADDLQFRQGDVIVIDEEVNPQWYRGRVVPASGAPSEKGGLFPSNYVEKLPDGSTGATGRFQAPYTAASSSFVPTYMPPQQQPGGGPQPVQDEQHKHSKVGKIGGQLGTAAVHGAGFAVGSGLVRAIF